jgi:hypothetical protein
MKRSWGEHLFVISVFIPACIVGVSVAIVLHLASPLRYSPMSRQKSGENKVDRHSSDFKLQTGRRLQEFDSRATDAVAPSYRS